MSTFTPSGTQATVVSVELRKASDGISTAKAAEVMGVTPMTIRRWIDKGILPATRFGDKMLRIHPQDLEAIRRPTGPAPDQQ